MRKVLVLLSFVAAVSLTFAQPFVSSEIDAPTSISGGSINEYMFSDLDTLNPITNSSASGAAIGGLYGGPAVVFRDWSGTRAYTNADGEYNLAWAKSIEETVPNREFIVTVREGWKWSDGVEMTVDDIIAGHTLVSDPEIESNSYSLGFVDVGGQDTAITLEKLDTYSYKVNIPAEVINAVVRTNILTVPAHIFMPVYEAEGAEGVKAMWGIDTDVSEIVSGGPYLITEYRAGERISFAKNPMYGEFVQAADGSALPGPDAWTVTIVEDQNQILAAAVTGQTSFYYPGTLDQVRGVSEAINSDSIGGELLANLGPGKLVDFMTYNFNAEDACKRELFRSVEFRQAIAIMIDREALVEAALGGLGFAAVDYRSEAVAPFVSDNAAFEFNPERGQAMLMALGYSEMDGDGVLTNPDTGCRVEFTLQSNSGNERRAQSAQVIAQTLAPYGVNVTAREVDFDTWVGAITGTNVDYEEAGNKREVDYDAQIWGLAGGDIDDPSFSNGIRPGTNLNSWNKSVTDVEPWELLIARLDKQIEAELDLNARIALYKEQMEMAREYLPMTPLISPAFHFYHNMDNVWDEDVMGSVTIESPYRPGNSRDSVLAAE